jgi:hypothetical protein
MEEDLKKKKKKVALGLQPIGLALVPFSYGFLQENSMSFDRVAFSLMSIL